MLEGEITQGLNMPSYSMSNAVLIGFAEPQNGK